MVCIYCGGRTQVVNSRAQKQANQVWRRRQCTVCQAIFTTQEAAELSTSLAVTHQGKHQGAFSKERLFTSIYDSCKHRPDAVTDATALTQTVISKLFKMHDAGAVARDDIVAVAQETLRHFDSVAATMYQAYHPIR